MGEIQREIENVKESQRMRGERQSQHDIESEIERVRKDMGDIEKDREYERECLGERQSQHNIVRERQRVRQKE